MMRQHSGEGETGMTDEIGRMKMGRGKTPEETENGKTNRGEENVTQARIESGMEIM